LALMSPPRCLHLFPQGIQALVAIWWQFIHQLFDLCQALGKTKAPAWKAGMPTTWGTGIRLTCSAAILAVGKPVVVLLFDGRPLSINLLAENADAILECWYLGQETGWAAADLLFGVANLGGK
jgi:hypothetical protein